MPASPLFNELLQAIAADASSIGSKELTLFCPIRGQQYNGELMVLGRAVNGWITHKWKPEDEKARGWLPVECLDSSFRKKVIDVAYEKSHQDKCPLLRVTKRWRGQSDYNYCRSAFWRVIRRVVDELGIAAKNEPEWPSHLIWSDLYKASPARKGNPSKELQRVQHDVCLRMLAEEVAARKPQRILFLTGHSRAKPFLSVFDESTAVEEQVDAPLKFAAKMKLRDDGHECMVVVGPHPQGKKEKVLADRIVESFEAIKR